MPSSAVEALSSVLIFDSAVLLVVVLVFWAGVFVARRLGSEAGYGLGALGLARPKVGYFVSVVLGILVGVGALITSVVLTLLSTFVLDRFGYSTGSNVQEPLMRGMRDWVSENPQVAIPAAIFVVVIFAPAVEEIIFRGVVFGGLFRLGILLSARLSGRGEAGAKRGGTALPFAAAALLSSVVFALLHFEPVILASLLVLAVALCVLYWRTGSLLPAFVAHATFNSFAVLVIILGGLGAIPA